MGLFSFLAGKSSESGDMVGQDSAAGERAAVATETPKGPRDGETPFVRPAAWDSGLDTGALTAPSPKSEADGPAVGPPDAALTAALQGPIIEVIKTVFDPEIPVDIYELGLIYDIAVDADRRVLIRMTLTSPACPSAQQLPSEVRYKVKAIPGVSDATVEIVWEPPWDKDRMSEAARLQLGFF
jgi:FeS assembly SUF system protein